MDKHQNTRDTYPSRIASPKGRMLLEPPRNRFQIWSAKLSACESDEKPTWPVAPPKESVMILPAAWHVLMSCARKEQFASAVPE